MIILYYDCFAGISGDMNLGAMLDLGVDQKYLLNELSKLPLGSSRIKISQSQRGGITGTKFEVVSPRTQSPSRHHLPKRTFHDIAKLIGESGLPVSVQHSSLHIFSVLARAEAKIHGQKIEAVHFHEIGAIDSIIDIVGAAVCLDYLKVDRVISSPLQLGGGLIHCNHGVLPVPAPATAEILKNVPVKTGLVPFEATTPTGAAIVVAMASAFTEKVDFTPRKIGYGLGRRDSAVPNVLRLFLGELPAMDAVSSGTETGEAVMIECNIDDMNPELYDNLMEHLFSAGAYDVFFTPIVMKKSRPALTVSVLCDVSKQSPIEKTLWFHSSTFGLRSYKVTRSLLPRKTMKIKTRYGEVSLKCGYLNGRMVKSKPEYEDCKKLARAKGVSLQDVYESIRVAKKVKK